MNRDLSLGLLLLLACCYSKIAVGQEENKGQLLRGIVLDKFSNVPVKGALVELLNHSPRITAISEADGSFTMPNIPVGRQRIRIEQEGFYENIVSILVDAGKEVILDIPLEELQKFSDAINADVFDVLTLEGSVAARDHIGGTAPKQVKAAVERARARL